jgi:hypothetical protein
VQPDFCLTLPVQLDFGRTPPVQPGSESDTAGAARLWPHTGGQYDFGRTPMVQPDFGRTLPVQYDSADTLRAKFRVWVTEPTHSHLSATELQIHRRTTPPEGDGRGEAPPHCSSPASPSAEGSGHRYR